MLSQDKLNAFTEQCLKRGLKPLTFFFISGDDSLLQVIRQIEKETNGSYIYADTSHPEEQLQSGRKGVVSQLSPVLVHDCKVYWGIPTKPEEAYREILNINSQHE